MPKMGAERQRAWRDRRDRLVVTLEQENAQLRADLADALAEARRLAGQACKHPAAVDGSHCYACGNDLW